MTCDGTKASDFLVADPWESDLYGGKTIPHTLEDTKEMLSKNNTGVCLFSWRTYEEID